MRSFYGCAHFDSGTRQDVVHASHFVCLPRFESWGMGLPAAFPNGCRTSGREERALAPIFQRRTPVRSVTGLQDRVLFEGGFRCWLGKKVRLVERRLLALGSATRRSVSSLE